MTRGDVPGTNVFGRPFKPMAVGLIVASLAVCVDTVLHKFGIHPIAINVDSQAGGIIAGLAALLMIVAWIIRSQRIYEIGLLLVMGAWFARVVEMILMGNAGNSFIPLSMSFMAGGAYWLEKISDNSKID